MAPTDETSSSVTEETSGQGTASTGPAEDATGSGTTTTAETTTPPTETAAETKTDPGQLPDDHPLVRTLAAQKEEIRNLRARGEAVPGLEAQIAELNKKVEATGTLQQRYDRLEEFLAKSGGPLSKALDSRSFTHSLFESDEPVEDLVAAWNRNNPSATSAALGARNSGDGGSKPTVNELLRAAAK